ncbi:MAG: hypothetical protein GTO41_03360 [Burkholderiales bacterium]|nr:hypothetical protein [Burkholderiales bacterium]
MREQFDALGLSHRLGATVRIGASAREGLKSGEEVRIIGIVRVEQREAEPDHPSWCDLPEGPLYIGECDGASGSEMLFLHESELEPA